MKRRVLICAVALAVLCSGMVFASGAGEAAAGPAKKVVLTYYVNANQQDDFVLAQEARFTAKYPNIVLDKRIVPEGASAPDAIAEFAAGTNPDWAAAGLPTVTNFIYNGMCRPLDDYFAKWPDFKHLYKQTVENFNVGGKHYALQREGYAMVLCYNKSIFKNAGLQPPKTWDEYLQTSIKLTDPSKNQWGTNLLVSYWTEWWFEYFVWMAGGDLTKQNPDGTLKLTFTDPAVVKAVEFYRRMVAAKVVQPDLSLDYGQLQNQFSTGRAAMTLYGSDGNHNFVNQGMKPQDVGYALLPVGPGGKPVSQVGGAGYFIYPNVSKEKADAAWAYISFIASKEESDLFLKNQGDKGGADPQVLIRDDLNISLGKINPELQAVVDQATKVGRLEFYGKGAVGSFIDQALRNCLANPGADIVKEFQAQQDLAKEALDKFNAAVLAAKKK